VFAVHSYIGNLLTPHNWIIRQQRQHWLSTCTDTACVTSFVIRHRRLQSVMARPAATSALYLCVKLSASCSINLIALYGRVLGHSPDG